MAAAQKMTTREVADQLGTDPKTLRRFLRNSLDLRVEKGNRHAFTKRDVQRITKAFEKAHAPAEA